VSELTSTTAPIVSTSALGHAYGEIVALHDVDLEVPAGSVGLVGANGAGKTTLIRILLGILDPTLGTVRVFDRDMRTDALAVRSQVGYMPERPCLPSSQTAADFMVYAARLAGVPPRAARQRASDVLTLVGLHEERFRYMGDYSTGMKQRAMLAQAIVHDPDLVFLDEPTAGLDPEGRDEMLGLIRRLGEFGINVLASSHVLSDIERTCDWVVMLDGGRVLRTGPLSGLTEADTVELEVLGDPALVADALRGAGAEVEVNLQKLQVRFHDGDAFDLVRDVIAATGTGIRSLGTRSTSLEDVFLGANGGMR
jgi:ABC-2 type transport system ATP-binding protein